MRIRLILFSPSTINVGTEGGLDPFRATIILRKAKPLPVKDGSRGLGLPV